MQAKVTLDASANLGAAVIAAKGAIDRTGPKIDPLIDEGIN